MLEAKSLMPGSSGYSCLPTHHHEHPARNEAEGAKGARDEILALVAHDLRNPLSLIQMATQLLLSDPAPDAETHAAPDFAPARTVESPVQ